MICNLRLTNNPSQDISHSQRLKSSTTPFDFRVILPIFTSMDIVNPHLVEYLLNVTPERDEILRDMEEHALERNFPIVGPLVGRMLFLLAKTTQAKRILELGSGFGYSAYWFAKAIGKDGEVICTEGKIGRASCRERV